MPSTLFRCIHASIEMVYRTFSIYLFCESFVLMLQMFEPLSVDSQVHLK